MEYKSRNVSDDLIAERIIGKNMVSTDEGASGEDAIRASDGKMPLRIVTAAAIFDGHDAAIGIFRRIFQSRGCEVIHLGHDRGADEVARAAIQEDAHAVVRAVVVPWSTLILEV